MPLILPPKRLQWGKRKKPRRGISRLKFPKQRGSSNYGVFALKVKRVLSEVASRMRSPRPIIIRSLWCKSGLRAPLSGCSRRASVAWCGAPFSHTGVSQCKYCDMDHCWLCKTLSRSIDWRKRFGCFPGSRKPRGGSRSHGKTALLVTLLDLWKRHSNSNSNPDGNPFCPLQPYINPYSNPYNSP